MTARVVIRADASRAIGSGHVYRCLTLAAELRRRSADVSFVMRERPGSLAQLAIDAGYPVFELPSPSDTGDLRPWGGVSEHQDADETIDALGGRFHDWMIVDHYALSSDWERRIQAVADKVLVIDDLDDRPHDCDVLMDQNYFGANTTGRYTTTVPASCRRLLGPAFALLQPEYAQVRRTLPDRQGPVRRLLVFFGGSDPLNQTAVVLKALRSPKLSGLAVDVVIGVNHPAAEAITAAAGEHASVTLHRGLPTLAGLMARADLFAGGGGGTTWERCCLGLPGIVSSDADNHAEFSARLDEDGFQAYLGPGYNLSPERWVEAISAMIQDPPRRETLSRRAMTLTDGMGAARVARVMIGSSTNEVRARRDIAGSGVSMVSMEFEDSSGVPLGVVHCARLDDGDVELAPVADASADGIEIEAQLARAAVVRLSQRGDWSPTFHRLANADRRPVSPLRITLLSDGDTWLNPALAQLEWKLLRAGHRIRWVHDPKSLVGGDIAFLLGCSKLVGGEQLALNSHNLVVHEDALPRGRGWSPMTWQILAGTSEITVTLFEAAQEVDSGPIFLEETVRLEGHELIDEWRRKQSEATLRLCLKFVEHYPAITESGRAQVGDPTYYQRRRPADSELDPDESIASQFDLFRVVDNERYPAFFSLRGHRFALLIRKLGADRGNK